MKKSEIKNKNIENAFCNFKILQMKLKTKRLILKQSLLLLKQFLYLA